MIWYTYIFTHPTHSGDVSYTFYSSRHFAVPPVIIMLRWRWFDSSSAETKAPLRKTIYTSLLLTLSFLSRKIQQHINHTKPHIRVYAKCVAVPKTSEPKTKIYHNIAEQSNMCRAIIHPCNSVFWARKPLLFTLLFFCCYGGLYDVFTVVVVVVNARYL